MIRSKIYVFLWRPKHEDRILYDSRQPEHKKYGVLVSILVKNFGVDMFKTIKEITSNTPRNIKD